MTVVVSLAERRHRHAVHAAGALADLEPRVAAAADCLDEMVDAARDSVAAAGADAPNEVLFLAHALAVDVSNPVEVLLAEVLALAVRRLAACTEGVAGEGH